MRTCRDSAHTAIVDAGAQRDGIPARQLVRTVDRARDHGLRDAARRRDRRRARAQESACRLPHAHAGRAAPRLLLVGTGDLLAEHFSDRALSRADAARSAAPDRGGDRGGRVSRRGRDLPSRQWRQRRRPDHGGLVADGGDDRHLRRPAQLHRRVRRDRADAGGTAGAGMVRAPRGRVTISTGHKEPGGKR